MMPADITTLEAAGILAVCVQMIPVNTRVDQAIAAHKVALRALESDPAAWDIAANTLRAIIFARTPVAADYRTKLDYPSALPETAWQEHPDQSAPAVPQRNLGDDCELAGGRRATNLRTSGLGIVPVVMGPEGKLPPP